MGRKERRKKYGRDRKRKGSRRQKEKSIRNLEENEMFLMVHRDVWSVNVVCVNDDGS